MKRFLCILTAVVFLASCKKDEDNKITKENLAGTYTLASAKASVFGSEYDLTTASILGPAIIPACQKDDEITLKTDNTFTWADVGQTCTPSSNVSGTWSLGSNNTININGLMLGTTGSSNISATIDKYDGKNLQLKDTVTVSAQQVPLTIVFTKK